MYLLTVLDPLELQFSIIVDVTESFAKPLHDMNRMIPINKLPVDAAFIILQLMRPWSSAQQAL
jgi:hypothetical protein